MILSKKSLYRSRLLPLAMIFFWLIISNRTQGQSAYRLYIRVPAEDQSVFNKLISYSPYKADSVTLIDSLKGIISHLQYASYLEANVDSIRVDTSMNVWLKLGRPYKWAALRNGNLDPYLYQQITYRAGPGPGSYFYYTDLVKIIEKALSIYENSGYPFARVWLDSVNILDGNVYTRLMSDKGTLYKNRQIITKGDAKLSDSYLSNYLGIRKGANYNASKLEKINKRLSGLPFITQTKPAGILFYRDNADLILYMDKKKAGRFDFLLGILPDSKTGKLALTGTLNAESYNLLGQGERLYVEYQRLTLNNQQLDLAANYPYILSLPVGVDGHLTIDRRDSSLLNTDIDFGIQYLTEGGNYIKAFWNKNAASLTSVDTVTVKNNYKLPDLLDVSRNGFGIEISYNKLDYRFNPRSGWSVYAKASAGIKNIGRNSLITELVRPGYDFNALYDSIPLRYDQYTAQLIVSYFQPLGRLHTLMLRINSALIHASGGKIYQNELYRLGGNKSLRGFDERSVLASSYAIGTLEYRFLLGKNSNFFLFADQAYIEDRSTAVASHDYPTGLGLGTNFETKVGIFTLSAAVGRRTGVPFNFRSTKLHFGYVSLF